MRREKWTVAGRPSHTKRNHLDVPDSPQSRWDEALEAGRFVVDRLKGTIVDLSGHNLRCFATRRRHASKYFSRVAGVAYMTGRTDARYHSTTLYRLRDRLAQLLCPAVRLDTCTYLLAIGQESE